MKYPNLRLTASCALPWILTGAVLYRLRIYLPGHVMLFMVLGLVAILTAMIVTVIGRLRNLGGDSANSQPVPTAGSNAHDECQPLAPAPLLQRRPWALPSRRAIILGMVSVGFGVALAHNYTETAEFIPASRPAQHALIALVGISVAASVGLVLTVLCFIDDCFEVETHGPESDAHRNL